MQNVTPLLVTGFLVIAVFAATPAQAEFELWFEDGWTHATIESVSNEDSHGEDYSYKIYARGPPEVIGTHMVGPAIVGVDYEVTIHCVAVECSVSSSEGWSHEYLAPDSDCYYQVQASTGDLRWEETETGSNVYHMVANLNALEYTGTC